MGKYSRANPELPYRGDDARHALDGRRGLVAYVTPEKIFVRWGTSPGKLHVYELRSATLKPGSRTWRIFASDKEIV